MRRCQLVILDIVSVCEKSICESTGQAIHSFFEHDQATERALKSSDRIRTCQYLEWQGLGQSSDPEFLIALVAQFVMPEPSQCWVLRVMLLSTSAQLWNDPKNAPLAIAGLIVIPLALADIATVTKAAQIRRKMSDANVAKLGDCVPRRMTKLKAVTGAHKA